MVIRALFPVAEFAKIPPRRSGARGGCARVADFRNSESEGGNIGMFRYAFCGAFSRSGICQNSPRRSGGEGTLVSSVTIEATT
jgi:hypothetical protein